MKKTVLAIIAMGFFLIACVDKKAEEEKKAAEINEQIEAVDKEINENFESLEKEGEELDKAINELDNL